MVGARDFGAVGVEEAQRGAGRYDGYQRAVVDVDQQCLRSCLLPVVNLADGANPSGGHADSVKLDEQFLGGVSAENIFDHLVDFLLVVHPRPPIMDGRG